MAKKPTQTQKDEIKGLVRWLYDRSDCESWSAFANKAGVLASSMSDWARGENAPSSYNLLKMMRAANLIDDGISESAGEVPDFQSSSIGRRLEALEETVATQGVGVTEALGLLARDLRKLERRLAREAASTTSVAKPG